MRALWSGTLSFGLINIPINIYSGIRERSIDLDMLHKKDLSPIRFARICKAEEKEVPYEEIVIRKKLYKESQPSLNREVTPGVIQHDNLAGQAKSV